MRKIAVELRVARGTVQRVKPNWRRGPHDGHRHGGKRAHHWRAGQRAAVATSDSGGRRTREAQRDAAGAARSIKVGAAAPRSPAVLMPPGRERKIRRTLNTTGLPSLKFEKPRGLENF
jgi:hypothetical protein